MRPTSRIRATAWSPATASRVVGSSIALAAILALLAACQSGTGPSSPRPSTGSSGSTELKVMEFNIEYGGEEVDFDGVIKAIEASDADVVGIEEGYGNMPKVAEGVGWPYYDASTQIVSRYPLFDPPGSKGLYTLVEISPGRMVAIGNVHLPSTRYGPFQIARENASAKDVVAIDRQLRVPAAEPTIDALSTLMEQGLPVFLVGDFNEPSHLDWTKAAVGLREHVEFPVRWPVSRVVAAAGLTDSYREVHPDPVQDPGLTWPASRPFVKGYNPGPNGAPADRIDFVYAGGPATATASAIVGERGGEGVDVPVSPWPTDHRATVSTFDVTPATPPTFVAVEQRLVEAGDEIHVGFEGSGQPGERIVIVPEGGDPAADEHAIAERSSDQSDGGTMSFSTEGWAPGAYDAVLAGADGVEVSRIAFWVRAPGAPPEIATARPSYAEGEPIQVEWRMAPGNRFDWIGIYKRGANPNVAYYIMWNYTGATVEGSDVFDEDAHGAWPLKPGEYSVYLLQDDSYEKLAGGNFAVRG
jgi:hypothetical protein